MGIFQKFQIKLVLLNLLILLFKEQIIKIDTLCFHLMDLLRFSLG